MTDHKIDWSKPVQTEHGRPFQLWTTEAFTKGKLVSAYPVRGSHQHTDGCWVEGGKWTLDGQPSNTIHPRLMNVPEKRVYWLGLNRAGTLVYCSDQRPPTYCHTVLHVPYVDGQQDQEPGDD